MKQKQFESIKKMSNFDSVTIDSVFVYKKITNIALN